MYLLRKYVRQAGAAPLPEPSQPSDPATLWAGDLRRSATLARAVLADGQNPSLPCPMAGDVGRGFEAQRSRKNPHERDHGDRAIGEFSGGKSGGMLRWRRCKKLHFHFLPLFPSFTLAACRGACPAARAGCPAGRGSDQGGRTWWISDDEGLDRIIGAGRRGLYDGVRGLCGPGNGSPHDNPGAISRAVVFRVIKPNIAGVAPAG
jgi:hypothetical protein